MSKKRNNVLVLEEDPTEFEIIGICSQLPEYRFIWSLNNELHTRFIQREESIYTYDKKGNVKGEFSSYLYAHPIDRVNFYLIKNKVDGAILVDEKTTIDYFLFIYDNLSFEVEDLIAQLKSMECVQGAYSFEQEEIPSAENLILQ